MKFTEIMPALVAPLAEDEDLNAAALRSESRQLYKSSSQFLKNDIGKECCSFPMLI